MTTTSEAVFAAAIDAAKAADAIIDVAVDAANAVTNAAKAAKITRARVVDVIKTIASADKTHASKSS